MSSHPDFVLCPQLTCVLHDNTIGYQRGDPLAQAMVEFLKANEEGRGSMKELAFEELTRFELRAISILADIHFDMVRSYLKASGLEHGLLLSFATVPLNVKRVIFRPPLSDS